MNWILCEVAFRYIPARLDWRWMRIIDLPAGTWLRVRWDDPLRVCWMSVARERMAALTPRQFARPGINTCAANRRTGRKPGMF